MINGCVLISAVVEKLMYDQRLCISTYDVHTRLFHFIRKAVDKSGGVQSGAVDLS